MVQIDFSTDLHMMLCNQLWEKVISRLRPCLETRPMLAPLVGSTNTDYSGKLDWFSSPFLSFLIPSFCHAQHPSSSTPYRWHPPRGGLHIWGIKENTCTVDKSLSKQQKKIFLCQQSAAFQRKLSALWRSFSNLTALSTNNGIKSELDNNGLDNLKKKI